MSPVSDGAAEGHRAIKENRVLTVVQKHGRRDFGLIGFLI